jgi:hypothetical protein
MKINDLFVILMAGGIGLYFLVSGIRGIKHSAMTVVNPDSHEAWPGMLGAVLYAMRRKAGLQSNYPPAASDKKIYGREARGRAWFHIILGTVCLYVVLLYFENVALQ